jgi:hypothetical protein
MELLKEYTYLICLHTIQLPTDRLYQFVLSKLVYDNIGYFRWYVIEAFSL